MFDNTFFIFDFDDTIMYSSYLNDCYRLGPSGSFGPSEYKHESTFVTKDGTTVDFEKIDMSGEALLKACITFGKVFIVSNANIEWINICLDKIPKVKKVIHDNSITIISTMTKDYNSIATEKRKEHAFLSLVDKLNLNNELKLNNTGITTQLISFGDCMHDRLASLNISNHYPSITVKNVLFDLFPSPETLENEQKLVLNCLEYIVKFQKNLDLKLKVTKIQIENK
jgi:hypothetical protein